MSWIDTIPYEKATGQLRRLYDRVKGPEGKVDNILLVHGLKPHTLEAHMTLYKNVLHHSANCLPKWLLETLGIYVSILNGCDYCVAHHYQGLVRLLGDEARATAICEALRAGRPEDALDPCEAALASYAESLTVAPASVSRDQIDQLRELGLEDGDILEANQVIAYFAYANRTVLGLGVTTAGDTLGLSPADPENPHDWHHL